MPTTPKQKITTQQFNEERQRLAAQLAGKVPGTPGYGPVGKPPVLSPLALSKVNPNQKPPASNKAAAKPAAKPAPKPAAPAAPKSNLPPSLRADTKTPKLPAVAQSRGAIGVAKDYWGKAYTNAKRSATVSPGGTGNWHARGQMPR